MRSAHYPGSHDVNPEAALAGKLSDHPPAIVRCPDTAAQPVPDRLDAVAHERAREDHRGPPCIGGRLPVSPVDGVNVVPVNRNRMPAERPRPPQIPSQHDLTGPVQPVGVDDYGQVAQALPAAVAECLPGGALGHLGVPAQHPDPVGQPVQAPAGQGQADADGQPRSHQAGGHVRRQSALQRVTQRPAPGLRKAQELFIADRSGRLQHRVIQRPSAALGENQMVTALITRVREVEPADARPAAPPSTRQQTSRTWGDPSRQ